MPHTEPHTAPRTAPAAPAGRGRSVLLCSLGASWAVVPEIYGFVAPEVLDLYRYHPEAARIREERNRAGLRAPDEIWIVTTGGERTTESLRLLRRWHRGLRHAPRLRVWRAAETDNLASAQECLRLRELTLRACLHASERAGERGQLVLSLAGGRKTMSADMQRAGSSFGCSAMLHVIDTGALPETLRQPAPETFHAPLGRATAACVRPVVLDTRLARNDVLDVELADRPPVQARHFPLPLAEGSAVAWRAQRGEPLLHEEISRREREGARLLGNFLGQLAQQERRESWRSLYRLPPRTIARLQRLPLDERLRPWLRGLPKAELHCHIGGILSLEDQQRVGAAIWATLSAEDRRHARERVAEWLDAPRWPEDWAERLRAGTSRLRAAMCAALLVHASRDALETNLFTVTEPRVALKRTRGFRAYELPGELTGSAVLTHPAALPPYAEGIVAYARSDHVRYLELRCSPTKYAARGDELGWLEALRNAIEAAGARTGRSAPASEKPAGAIDVRLLLIADRRLPPEEIERVVRLAVTARERLEGFVVGIDLAGDESDRPPSSFAHAFEPAFATCLPVTVHAGEGESAANIWEAAYRLHADRVGHGLTLIEREDLCERFRDRGIALELCPTSNVEVVGYHDPARPDTEGLARYPLGELWRRGVPLSVCTDNPGISRTSGTEELLVASRMSGGLPVWDALAILKQGFERAFAPARVREALLKEADAALYAACLDLPRPDVMEETNA